MTVSEATRLHAGATIGGKYRLVALLAKGGMGSVWRARHVELGVEVAIKFVDGSIAQLSQARARFAREAKAAASLRHPNVVDVRDYGIDGGLPYLVMELLGGQDLAERLKCEGRLSLAQTSAIVSQVARALGRAHKDGIVHRDLKPSNVFLAKNDGEEVVKLLDFGVAKDTYGRFVLGDLKQSNISLVEIDGIEVLHCHDPVAPDSARRPSGEHTQPGTVVGSPRYMSPEQLSACKDIDGRSDVWSLGVITFRCLTGDVPFLGDMKALVQGILLDPIPSATRAAPDLPPEIDAFFAKALARNRDDRFATADEMAAALAAIATPNPPPEVAPTSVRPIEGAPTSATPMECAPTSATPMECTPTSATPMEAGAEARPETPDAPSAPEGKRDGRPATLPAESAAASEPAAPAPGAGRKRPFGTLRLTSDRLGAVRSNWRAALDATLPPSTSASERAAAPEAKRRDSLDPYARPRSNRAAAAGLAAALAAACLSVVVIARSPDPVSQGVPAASAASVASVAPDPPAAPPHEDPVPEAASTVAPAPPSAPPAPVVAPAVHRPAEGTAFKRPAAKKPRSPSSVF